MTLKIENIKFWIKGKTIYDIHSPFLFELLNSFMDNPQKFYVFNSLKNNYYPKSTKIKLFKIIKYWNPQKIYLLHPIHSGSLQFLSSTNSNLSIIEVNGCYQNFAPCSCFILDGKNQSSFLLESLNRLALSIKDENQMVIILNLYHPLQLSPDEIDSRYNLRIFTKELLILFAKPEYRGKRNHFIVSRFTKPWRLGFFN